MLLIKQACPLWSWEMGMEGKFWWGKEYKKMQNYSITVSFVLPSHIKSQQQLQLMSNSPVSGKWETKALMPCNMS